MRYLFTILALILIFNNAQGQVTFGAQGMIIRPNTTVYLDSLKLDNYNTPLTINNNLLQASYQALPGNPNNSIARVYEFTNPIAFNGTVGLYYADGELGTNTEANLQVSYQMQSNGVWTTTANSIIAAPVNYVYSPGYNNNLYRVTAVSSGTVLPITLLRFDARKAGNNVLLEWVTSSEKNNDHFIVEHSSNGNDFEKLNLQQSKGMEGNSNEPITYTYEDPQPFKGDNFYRLQQVDKDGSIRYSPVRLVSFDGDKVLVTIYPNPATDHLFIDITGYKDKRVSTTIYDGQGRVVYQTQTDVVVGRPIDIPVNNITSGIYYLNMTDVHGHVILQTKFAKQ